MSNYPFALQKMINAFKTLPGIGQKSAERFAFHLLACRPSDVESMTDALLQGKRELKSCKLCGCLLADEACRLCDPGFRDGSLLCIVAHVKDVFAIEGTREYKGMYHVLGGVLSPLDGFGPEQLNLFSLKERMSRSSFDEVIIAIDSTLEGDTTSLYIKEQIERPEIKVSRLAFGLPIGSSLDYVDGGTLARALSGRT